MSAFDAETVSMVVVVGRDGIPRAVDDIKVIGENRPLCRYVNICSRVTQPCPVGCQAEAIRATLTCDPFEVGIGLLVVESKAN